MSDLGSVCSYMGVADGGKIESAWGWISFGVWVPCTGWGELCTLKTSRLASSREAQRNSCFYHQGVLIIKNWIFLIWQFSGDCIFRWYGIHVLLQGLFWRGCVVVAVGCSEFAVPWVWTYPDVCLLVIETETRKIYGEGWVWAVAHGMLTSSY